MKYIMVDEIFPVLFGDNFTHASVARNLSSLGHVTSAGFVEFNHDGTPICTGESVSLELKPAEHDTKIVSRFLERQQ